MAEFQIHKDEHIILTIRKHPLILIGKLIPFAVLDYLPYLLPKLANATEQLSVFAPYLSFENSWFTFLIGIYWLFVWMGAFGVFIDHYLDQWILTNERLVDINQKGFWDREVDILMLDRVENVETKTFGVLGNLFGFGTVSVETAGAEAGRFAMRGLANSIRIRDKILAEVAKQHDAKPE